MATQVEWYSMYPDNYPNVYYLDDDPEQAAKAHSDNVLSKMILEACQILSIVWHNQRDAAAMSAVYYDWGPPIGATPFKELTHLNSLLCGQRIYRMKHTDHPSIAWASLYGGNYDWLYRLGAALLVEYTYRHGRIHACTPVLRTLELMPPALVATADQWCDAPQVMPAQYVAETAVEGYRAYCFAAPVKYTKRKPPVWAN